MKYAFQVLLLFLLQSICAQHQDKLDFTHANVLVAIDPYQEAIAGEVTYTFIALDRIDSVFLDAKKMEFTKVSLNGRKTKYANNGKTISVKKILKKGKTYKLTLEYSAKPKQTVYFIGWQDSLPGNEQIWTQGQGKYTSHWLPSFDDMTEKVEFDLDITFDSTYDVVANGKLKNITVKDSLKTWSFDMEKPMSSYLLAFAIGDYENEELVSKSGVPIENYYYPEDSSKVEPTYRYTKQIFDFLEREIGVPYPWLNYKQIPVRDFLYAGMENTGTTIFSDSFLIDSTSFVDKNYVNVNAHELAHQWFGNLVTEKDGNHHWLHEGFATYYAYLVEKEIFGEEHFYWKLYETARQLRELSEEGKGEALTDPKASSLTFYEKGAWALHMLREEVGDEAFKNGIKNYLEKYRFKNVIIGDFLNEIEKASSSDLADFEKLWLNNIEFPFEKAKDHLEASSESLNDFLKLQWELIRSPKANDIIIQRYWDGSASTYLKKNIILQYHTSFSPDLLKDAFKSDEIGIRQALAVSLNKIPVGLESEFESLLKDKSYITVENALYKLWIHNPDGRKRYLDTTKGIIGLPNKNVRILWLLLAVLTKDYLTETEKKEFRNELMGYTSPEYPFEVRQQAFSYISEVFALPDKSLRDLVNASVHHSWQFRKFARNLLDKIMENESQRERVEQLVQELNGEELRYIKSKLNTE